MVTKAVVMSDSQPYKAFMFIDDTWEVVASSADPEALKEFMEEFFCEPGDYYEVVGW